MCRSLREEESQEIVKLVQFLPHYGQLNPHPSLWQILFDNQYASQNDADDLIIRTEDEDDGHLLTRDPVEEQQPVQTTVRDSNDDQVQKSMTSAYARIRGSR
ncbi:hypothetical protein B9Z55_011064 [Caenorhabditis nigoni]|uniref:Uncharacterized protein n=1 Tax=Caenorhabditis nigoni TaxID=1611254 RepID=A0A2G5UIL6_9PELO|nr:hypothetical protein B9Z55_011064 [Caenorhabditis nigoni]